MTESSRVLDGGPATQGRYVHLYKGEVASVILLIIVMLCLGLDPSAPFTRGFYVAIGVSLVMHVAVWIILVRFQRFAVGAFVFSNLANILLMGFVAHCSGGILSPFNFLFIGILISATVQGLHYVRNVFISWGVFLAVVLLEWSGTIAPVPISPQAIYANGYITCAVTLAIMGAMYSAAFYYNQVFKTLAAELQAEQEQKSLAVQRLAQLDASSQVGLLVHKISHEINGPLTAFLGFVQSIQSNEQLSPVAREDSRLVERETRRVTGLVKELLNYSKPAPVTHTEVDPGEVIDAVLGIMRFYIDAKRIRGISFSEDYRHAGGCRVLGSQHQLQQVYFNLLKNSVEVLAQRPEGGVIEIRTSSDGDRVVIAVRDDGPGIPAGVVGKLGNESFSTKKDGGGVGLMIVRQILDLHRGGLAVESREGHWTEFRTWLPVIRKP